MTISKEAVEAAMRAYAVAWIKSKKRPADCHAACLVEALEAAAPFIRADGRELETAIQVLEIIAGKKQCLDNLMSHGDVAREALRIIRKSGDDS